MRVAFACALPLVGVPLCQYQACSPIGSLAVLLGVTFLVTMLLLPALAAMVISRRTRRGALDALLGAVIFLGSTAVGVSRGGRIRAEAAPASGA